MVVVVVKYKGVMLNVSYDRKEFIYLALIKFTFNWNQNENFHSLYIEIIHKIVSKLSFVIDDTGKISGTNLNR